MQVSTEVLKSIKVHVVFAFYKGLQLHCVCTLNNFLLSVLCG